MSGAERCPGLSSSMIIFPISKQIVYILYNDKCIHCVVLKYQYLWLNKLYTGFVCSLHYRAKLQTSSKHLMILLIEKYLNLINIPMLLDHFEHKYFMYGFQHYTMIIDHLQRLISKMNTSSKVVGIVGNVDCIVPFFLFSSSDICHTQPPKPTWMLGLFSHIFMTLPFHFAQCDLHALLGPPHAKQCRAPLLLTEVATDSYAVKWSCWRQRGLGDGSQKVNHRTSWRFLRDMRALV